MDLADDKKRCSWVNLKNEIYVRYHDEEWGKPVHDDHTLFEMLVLECFQTGLSWECVLNKRLAFREAFDGFNIERVCNYDENKVNLLLQNNAIIKNRLKIEAAINNAKVFMQIQNEYGSFAKYIWHWSDNTVIRETGLTKSKFSETISKDLKKKGMKFVGSTVIYAYLQAVGVINSHDPECFLG